MRRRTTCPAEHFPTVEHAEQAILERRTRALLAGSPRDDLTAYPCGHCDGAHLTRTDLLRTAA